MERIPLHLTRQSTVEENSTTRNEKAEELSISKTSKTPSSISKEIMLIPR